MASRPEFAMGSAAHAQSTPSLFQAAGRAQRLAEAPAKLSAIVADVLCRASGEVSHAAVRSSRRGFLGCLSLS